MQILAVRSQPRLTRPLTAVAFLVLSVVPCRGEWTTFQHDNARSGATTQPAPTNPRATWVHRSATRPRAAWDEPAIWDGWSKTHNLTNRQTFDKALHVAVANGLLYFGSTVDDKLYCLDAATGAAKWHFYTEGPIRFAPVVANGSVYCGSDDGYVYCLDATNGRLRWKHRPGPTARRIPGNGRVISPWAIRTGLCVVDNRVFCGAGVIPSETVYVACLDATTGEEVWQSTMNDLPAQGYLLASSTRLYVVTSRDRPLVFDAETGQRLAQVGGGAGGTFALLSGDTLLYGPGKTGSVNLVGGESHDVLASFDGRHMIVSRPYSYLHKGRQLTALDRETYVQLYGQRRAKAAEKDAIAKQLQELPEADREAQQPKLSARITALDREINELSQQIAACVKWTAACDCQLSLILAGGQLIAGGEGQVMAIDARTGEPAWSRDVAGKAYGLAVSDGRLYVSTDEGAIYCFGDSADDLTDGGRRRPACEWRGPRGSVAGVSGTLRARNASVSRNPRSVRRIRCSRNGPRDLGNDSAGDIRARIRTRPRTLATLGGSTSEDQSRIRCP